MTTIITLDGKEKTLSTTNIEALRETLRGELLCQHEEGYDDARKIYNAMIDKRPALIARCADVADVITAVNFARDHEVLLAVRGGGHNGPGLALCNGGLVIDLSPMKGVHVDPSAQTVRVASGCTWGDVDHATHAFGMAVPCGVISTTGVPGLTLGGGHGYLARKYGLTIDSLLSADVVLADGRAVSASADELPDLFWALRGGGGNFGVVTSFLFRGHPVSTVYGGATFWPLEQTAEVLRWYSDFTAEASNDLYGFFALLVVPPAPHFPESLHGKKMCGVIWCYTGAMEKAEQTFQPILGFGPPVFQNLGSMPFPALQTAFDELYPPGLQWYWKGDFIRELDDEAIARHVELGAQIPTAHSTMHLYPIDGAVHHVSKEGTAFAYRDVRWSKVIAGVDPDPANAGKITDWARSYWEALHPYSAGASYVNFMMEEGNERVQATYGENYQRLVEVKRRYDPSNLFRVNQNINPAGR